MFTRIRIGLQYFGEPDGGDQAPPQELNFEELYKTNERFKAFVAAEASRAVSEYQQKQQRINDDKLSEAEKLKSMTSEEVAEYYRKKYEASELEKQKIKDAESLKSQTVKLLSDGGIPAEFISDFDFNTATADSIKIKIGFLSGYEIYPKGTFETKVNDAVSEKLRQKAPEGGGTPPNDSSKTRKYFGL